MTATCSFGQYCGAWTSQRTTPADLWDHVLTGCCSLQASTASAVAAVTLLFTFMAAIAQRFLVAYTGPDGP